MVIIKAMNGKSTPEGSKLKNIISRIRQKVQSFASVSFYHIKRKLNKEVEFGAKREAEISPGTLIKKGVYNFRTIP
jgi:hypothetical protein